MFAIFTLSSEAVRTHLSIVLLYQLYNDIVFQQCFNLYVFDYQIQTFEYLLNFLSYKVMLYIVHISAL